MINDLFEYFDKLKLQWKVFQTNRSDVNTLQKLKLNVIISVFSGHPSAGCKWGPCLKAQGCKMCPVRTTEERQKKNQSDGRMEINKRKLKKLQVNSSSVYILEQSVNT